MSFYKAKKERRATATQNIFCCTGLAQPIAADFFNSWAYVMFPPSTEKVRKPVTKLHQHHVRLFKRANTWCESTTDLSDCNSC